MRDRDHYDRYERYDRYDKQKHRDEKQRETDSLRRRKDDRSDKFMGSLSEGQKHKESSSGSELGDIDIDDEDDEEKIIEMRRKKREELMKVKKNWNFK